MFSMFVLTAIEFATIWTEFKMISCMTDEIAAEFVAICCRVEESMAIESVLVLMFAISAAMLLEFASMVPEFAAMLTMFVEILAPAAINYFDICIIFLALPFIDLYYSEIQLVVVSVKAFNFKICL